MVARVNGDIVTLSEFEARQLAAVQQAPRRPGRDRDATCARTTPASCRRPSTTLLILQRGGGAGHTPARRSTCDEVIEGIKKENNIADDAELQRQLRREGMSLDDLKRNIERSIVRRQVLSRELEAKTAVERRGGARGVRDATRPRYARRASVHLQEIVVAATRSRPGPWSARARAGEDFAALARAHSTAASAAAGGDLGRPAPRAR